MSKMSRLKKDEDGSGLIICIFVLFFMFAVGGLVVDVSILYKTRGEMRRAANAAALSGAQEIRSKNATLIESIVEDILDKHSADYTSNSDNWRWESEENDTIIKVTLKQTVPTYFMKVFGINSVPLEVVSRAKVSPIAAVTGAMPLGVSAQSIGLGENMEVQEDMEWKEFTLKTSPSDTNFGKYGIISFNRNDADEDVKKDSGAKPYMNYLENGYSGEVDVGDMLFAQSGSVAADDKIMNDKIHNSIYDDKTTLEEIKNLYLNDNLDYTDSRIMLIIIYKEGSIIDSTNNIREITVAGFAYFYLDSYDKSKSERDIEGYFIPGIFNNISDDKALNLGTYGVKLVE